MISTISARRYAEAIFQIAQANNDLDNWKSELRKAADVMRDEQISDFIDHPKVSFDLKAELLREQLKTSNQLVLNLCYLLILKGRLKNIHQIAEQYDNLLDQQRGIEHALVTTAVPVDTAEERRITGQLEKVTGKKLAVRLKVDPSILGGVIAKIEDTLIDGSVRNMLDLLRRGLAEAGK